MNVRDSKRTEFTTSKRVVCATDLQPRSDVALRRAALLARGMHARLTVLHVIDARQSWRAVRAASNRAYVELLSKLEEFFGREAAAIDIAVRVGEPLDVISSVVDEQRADLLVVAAPQPRRLDSIVGTTAERLIRATRRPLVVARGDVPGAYQRVIVATDASKSSASMMKSAAGTGIFNSAQVTVMHAFHPPYEGMLRSAGVDEEGLQGYRRGWSDHMGKAVRGLLTAAGIETKGARVLVPAEQPLAAIHGVLDQHEPELLVIGASRWFLLKRLLLGSVADGVLRSVDCDVLVIPPRVHDRRSVDTRIRRGAGSETDHASAGS